MGQKIFPIEVSITLIYNVMGTLKPFNDWTKKMTRKCFTHEAMHLWELSSVCLLVLFYFYPSAFLLDVFSLKSCRRIRVYACVCMHACVCLNCSLQSWSSARIFQSSFYWTVQTTNSYAMVSISRLNYVEWKEMIYFFRYLHLSRSSRIVQSHRRERKTFLWQNTRPRRQRETSLIWKAHNHPVPCFSTEKLSRTKNTRIINKI